MRGCWRSKQSCTWNLAMLAVRLLPGTVGSRDQSITVLPCPLQVSIVGNSPWRQPVAALTPGLQFLPPSSALSGQRLSSHAACTLLHSAWLPPVSWTTLGLACLQLATINW